MKETANPSERLRRDIKQVVHMLKSSSLILGSVTELARNMPGYSMVMWDLIDIGKDLSKVLDKTNELERGL